MEEPYDFRTKEELLAYTPKELRHEFCFWWRNLRRFGFKDVLSFSADNGILPVEFMGILLNVLLVERNPLIAAQSIFAGWREAKTYFPYVFQVNNGKDGEINGSK